MSSTKKRFFYHKIAEYRVSFFTDPGIESARFAVSGGEKNILHVNYADGSSCLPSLEMNSKTGLKVMKYGNRVAAQIGCGKFAWAQEARDL